MLYLIYKKFFSSSFLFRSFYLFAFFVFILFFVSHCFYVLSLLTNIFFSQFRLLSISNFQMRCFHALEGGFDYAKYSKRLVAIVFAVLLLFCHFLWHELTQRRSEKKKLSFDDKFS